MNIRIANDAGTLTAYKNNVNILKQNPHMGRIQWKKKSVDFDWKKISKLEQTLNIKIPEEYLNFLLQCNGSNPEVIGDSDSLVCSFCDTRLGGKNEPIPIFEQFTDPDEEKLISEIEEMMYYIDGQPKEDSRDIQTIQLLPIYCCNGNFMCLDFRINAQEPTISYVDIEAEDIYPVADSFVTFLISLGITS